MAQLQMRLPDLSLVPAAPVPAMEFAPRHAVLDDAGALGRLLGAAFPEAPWSADRARVELLDEPSVVEVLVIDGEQGLLATASARYVDRFPGAGYVHWVGTEPQARGRELGRAVVLAVLGRFREDGMSAAVLETDDDRLPAIAAYLGLGFVPAYAEPGHEARWSAVFFNLAAHRRRARGNA